MTKFEEWWANMQYSEYERGAASAAWDAATFAANNRAGDAANEAEKDARRETAMLRLKNWPDISEDDLNTIIKEAQG